MTFLADRLDFNNGFGSNDPAFCKWCEDLFVFYWNKIGKRMQA